MQELYLPHNENLHRWLGYKGNVKSIAIWWQGEKMCISDGWTTSNKGYPSALRLMECTKRFKRVLSQYDYGQNSKGSWCIHNMEGNVILIDNIEKKLFIAPKEDALKMLSVYNVNRDVMQDEIKGLSTNAKQVENWGVGENELVSKGSQMASNVVGRPSLKEFEDLSDWLSENNTKLKLPPKLTVISNEKYS